MGTYQKALEAVEAEMQSAVDALFNSYQREVESNADLVPGKRAVLDRTAAAKYQAASQAAKERALAKEGPLFEDLRRDVEKALTAAPTPEQLAYLQTLSLRHSLTDDDIRTAAVAVAGNAAAEANVAALADSRGMISAAITIPPSLPDLLRRIDDFEESRRRSVTRYRSIQQNGQEDDIHTMTFSPGAGWSRVMEDAEGALERYGAE